MARALIKGSKITGLSLRLNKMSDEGVRCLFEGLQGCKDLEFLDVSFNKGSDQVSNIYYILQPYFISYFVVL
jgi:Ran GTPase-activating protein (RanGAP) involved in mRNA processing and transport